MKLYDYLIVGQGLAGTWLAECLLKDRKSILVIDHGLKNASRTAPGMFNPITGRRMSKSWMIEEILAVAYKEYPRLELELRSSFFHPLNMYRFFSTDAERTATINCIIGEDAENFVNSYFSSLKLDGFCNDFSQGCIVQNSGYVDTIAFLDAWYNKHQEIIVRENFDVSSLKITDEGILWQEKAFSRIIFCDGYRGSTNPYFNYLPWNLARGEVLTIYAPLLNLEIIYNRSLYIIPVGNHIYRIGATYSWDSMNENPTEEGKTELINKLDAILCIPYEIIAHDAGVRPAVTHRRPFLGIHPKEKRIGIFSGMGTKGVLLAPYMAAHFVSYLEYGTPIMQEVDIAHYEKLFHV